MIQDLTAETGSDDGTIHLSWTAPGDDGGSGMVSAYLIRYSQAQLTESNWDSAMIFDEYVPPLPAGQNQLAVIDGLSAGQMYYVAIKACDDALNLSPLSNNASCKAGTGFPLDIDDGQVVAVGPVSRPKRFALAAFVLINPAMASGSEITVPSHWISPSSSTTQIEVSLRDTPIPT